MEKKVKVNKIILTIGNKEIELTVDEAKDLHSILGEMFKTPEKDIVYVPYVAPSDPNPYQPYKWIVNGTAKKWDGIYNPPMFVSGANTNGDFPYETGSINLTCTA